MGWFSDAIDAVSDAVESAANTVGELVSDIIETAGNAVQDEIDATAGKIPLMRGLLRWTGRIVSNVFNLAGTVVKGGLGIVGGVIGGSLRLMGGIFSFDRRRILEGLGDIGSSIAGAVILVGGKAISLVQSILPVEARDRKLTREEVWVLRRVFRGAIAYHNIRIVDGKAGIFDVTAPAFTLGNTIYLKDHDISEEKDLLVHECAHVWQYQNIGARYASDAIYAQWFIDDGYSWRKEIERGNDQWVSFNAEAQAQFLEDIYARGDLVTPDGTLLGHGQGAFYDADGETTLGKLVIDGIDYTERADIAVAVVRGST